MSSRLFHASLLLATACLAGCSGKHDEPPAAQQAAPTYQAVARGRIDIEGGLLRLSMPRDGVVAEIAAHEGDSVRKGQWLARLDTQQAQLAIDAAQAELQQAQAQVELLQTRVKAAQVRAQRLNSAAEAGAADGQSADDARQAADQLQGESVNARAAVAIATQKLAGARYELSQRSLVAPVDGNIVSRNIQPGAAVSPSSGPVFVLLPNAPRIVRAEVNESFVGAIRDGMHADVLDDSGNGNAPLSAHVLRIGTVFGASALE
ncbi:MAG TPA: HlyD family efflux transporter periplasmic adaptor subunit, partial [Dyella sp.]|uniref:efflux RND transporter periplasmic adaptor subunit n=1 Tax=Dyella sp. TaxID=1869338 RepID=UPI002F931838